MQVQFNVKDPTSHLFFETQLLIYPFQHIRFERLGNMYTTVLFALISLVVAAPLTRVYGEDGIAGRWIVKMKGDVATQAHDDLLASMSTKPDYEYAMPGFRGFSGSISEEELVLLQASEHVSYTPELTYLN